MLRRLCVRAPRTTMSPGREEETSVMGRGLMAWPAGDRPKGDRSRVSGAPATRGPRPTRARPIKPRSARADNREWRAMSVPLEDRPSLELVRVQPGAEPMPVLAADDDLVSRRLLRAGAEEVGLSAGSRAPTAPRRWTGCWPPTARAWPSSTGRCLGSTASRSSARARQHPRATARSTCCCSPGAPRTPTSSAASTPGPTTTSRSRSTSRCCGRA